MNFRFQLGFVVVGLVGLMATVTISAEPFIVSITDKSQPRLVIQLGPAATDRVRKAANTLTAFLEKISDAKFEIATGNGMSGIALGRLEDFPSLAPTVGKIWDIQDPTRSEDYLLRSHKDGLLVLGATELAVEHAVWDLLYRLGYRQFFPGAAWEVIPKNLSLRIAVDSHEHPSYYARRIWYGYGPAAWAKEPYAQWCAKNRATSGIELRSGHAYDGMLSRNKAEFAKHPEYLGLFKGERKTTKFCISNPALRQLIVEDALRQFAMNSEMQSLSVDPSDGGGWCECEACQKLGSVSDRAVTLANSVATAVEEKYPGKFIGMYAYSQHSPPPTIKVHPRVVISVATAFITGGHSVDELMAGWQKQGATVGVREYYSVHTWDRDLPGKARGANLTYLREKIPHFHSLGARFLSSESSDNWACNGLGYYLASRLLWNVDDAKKFDELKADFFEKAFGPAKGTMEKFYSLIDAANRPLLTDDLMGRLYRLLDEAYKQTDDAQVHARLRDLALYVRYLELWTEYENVTGPDRQRNFETMARFAYRMRHSMMIHTVGLVRDVPARDKQVFVTKNVQPGTKEDKNPWISNEPFTADDLKQLISDGIARRKLLDFEPVAFSDQLVPASKLKLADVPVGSMGIFSRGVRNYFTWVDSAPANITLQAAGGLVYGNKGKATIQLFPAAEVEGKSVAEASVAPDKQEQTLELKSTFTGLHRVTVSDHGAGTRLAWADGLPMTVSTSPEAPAAFHGRWSLYFYVPKGTKVVGGFGDGEGSMQSPSGKTVYKFTKRAEYFSVPVPAGEDGKLWRFDRCAGPRLLMTVPPYVARSAKELLLPVEVVTRDSSP